MKKGYKNMKEKEFMELLNTLAKEVVEHFEGEKRNTMFVRYYIVSRFHFIITIQKDYARNEFRLDITGMSTFKISSTHNTFSKHISSLFVVLPELIVAIIRELNSCD